MVVERDAVALPEVAVAHHMPSRVPLVDDHRPLEQGADADRLGGGAVRRAVGRAEHEDVVAQGDAVHVGIGHGVLHQGKVELARQEFYKVYHKSNIVKWIVSGVCILLIVCGWLIPNAIEALKEYSMMIALIACGVGLVTLLVFNYFWKKNVQTAMNRYFREYYEHTNAYVFADRVTNLEGSIDNKIEDEEFKNCDLYKDIGKVGSRATYTFEYDGKTIKVCDAAAQVIAGKALHTVFVGKYLYTTNEYKGSDILIYFKGNKRALPPTNLAGRKVFSDSKNIVIYGDKGTEKVITARVREALNEFKTNKTFVDMAISIREGMTYFAMGYEDDLMVIALEKPFDPNPTVQYAGDLRKVLKLIALLK